MTGDYDMYISRGMPPSPGIGEAAHGPGTSLHLTPRRGKGNMARREGFEPPTLRFEVSRKGKK
jgi:hypothetical protein